MTDMHNDFAPGLSLWWHNWANRLTTLRTVIRQAFRLWGGFLQQEILRCGSG
jgi:hypothetical protein